MNVLSGSTVETNIGATLGQLLQKVLVGHGDKLLQVDSTTEDKLTASELLRLSSRLARWMQKQGLAVGDVVSVSSENNIEFTVLFAAALLLGVTLAPVNPAYTEAELEHIFKITKPILVFTNKRSSNTVRQSLKSLGNEASVYLIESEKVDEERSLQDILSAANDEEDSEAFVSPALDVQETVANIMCSSGTTGMPKGVMLTQHNIIAMLCAMKKMAIDSEVPSIPGVSIGLVPFFHSMGLLCNLITLLAGTTLLLFRRFEWKKFLQAVQEYKITTLVIPPPIIVMLCQDPEVKNYDLSHVEYIRSSAASMSKELQQKVTEQFKLKEVTQGYGLTEGTLGLLLIPKVNKFGSVGKVVPGMKVKVVDPDSGKAVGVGEEGELCFQGPLVMKGYAGDPTATAQTIDEEGWLHTGDIGYYDEDGYFFIVDRLKELIKYKGFQVPPAELESLLLGHPDVRDAAVVGLPDELAGELPLAFVVLKEGVTKPTEQEIIDYVNGKISAQKHLRGGVRFIENIPRNDIGKILRRVLRDSLKTVT